MLYLACTTDVAPCPLADQVWLAADAALTFASLGIDSATVTLVFVWGVTSMLACWALGYGGRLALDVIRKI